MGNLGLKRFKKMGAARFILLDEDNPEFLESPFLVALLGIVEVVVAFGFREDGRFSILHDPLPFDFKKEWLPAGVGFSYAEVGVGMDAFFYFEANLLPVAFQAVLFAVAFQRNMECGNF